MSVVDESVIDSSLRKESVVSVDTVTISVTSNDSESSIASDNVDVLSFKYPEGTIGSDVKANHGRYYHTLSPENEEALAAVNTFMDSHKIEIKSLGNYGLHQDLTLLRYLRANNMDVDKTIEHIKRNIEYRKEHNVSEVFNSTPNELLGAKLSDVLEYLVHWQYSFDKTGRPIVYRQYGKIDASKIKKIAGFENVMKYHIWEQELIVRMCTEQSFRLGQIIETITVVIDVQDMRMSQVTGEFLTFMKMIGQIDASQYPEILGRMFIINTPMAFPIVWRLVKVWLDPVVASKIQICGGPNDWKPKLLDFIGEDHLPENYGGKLPALSSNFHPYSGFMASTSKIQDINYWTSNLWKSA